MFLLMLLFWPLLTQASTYTFTWCPVKFPPGYLVQAYFLCIENTSPTSSDSSSCQTARIGTFGTSYAISVPTNTMVWVRVQAGAWPSSTYSWVYSGFSNAVQIVDGLTPPAIGGCF